MMKFNLFVVGASALATAQPALAQSAEGAANEAAEAVAEAAEKAAESAGDGASVLMRAPPPPPIRISPAPPPTVRGPRIEYPTDPRPNEGLYRLIKPVDYPIEAWNEGQEGFVGYDIQVNADGTAERCDVTDSSGHVLLDNTTCELVMERLTFKPALDGEDEPVAGTFSGSYTWRKRDPEMPQMSITYRYLHGADGQSSECEFLRLENIPEKMREDIERDIARDRLCNNNPGRTRGIPYRDENGVPVAKRVTVTFDVALEDVE